MSSTPERIDLPERLQELSIETQQIVNNAVAFEHDINGSGVNFERKKTLVTAALRDLDRRAMNVFFGQRVEIEGAYSYPVPMYQGNDVILKTIHEYGVRRGESQGFYGHLVDMQEGEEECSQDDLQAKFFHGMTLGTISVRSSYVDLSAEARLQAPVTNSGLSLCIVEDYKNLVAAEQKVRQNKDDELWTDTVDAFLYDPDGPDLKQIGDTLSRLRLLQGDKVHDYVTYINSALKTGDDVAAVICDHMLDYDPQRSLPIWITAPDLISGWDPTIGMGDAYKIDRAQKRVLKMPFQEPILTLRAQLDGSTEEHILHIPLDAIQCSEFK